MQLNVKHFGVFLGEIAKKIGLPESSPVLFSVARYNYPMQFLGCKSKYFVVCFYGCLLLASLCLVLSIPLLVAQSNPFIPIRNILEVRHNYYLILLDADENQYVYGGDAGLR